MRIEQLRHLSELAKCETMNKAAENLFISQSTLRSSINALEEELGVSLVSSTRYGSRLTAFGKRVVQESGAILDCIDAWKQDAKSSLDLKEDINLGIAQIDSYLIFQSHLLDIKKEYPNITLRLLRHSATEIMQNIKLGRYRIGTILAHPDDVAAIEESLSVFSLNLNLVYEDQVLLYINQENPLAQQPMVTVSELLQYSFCGYSQLEMWRNDSCSFFATGFNEKNVVHVDTAENILNLVSQDRCCYGVMFESWRTTSCFPQNIVTKPIQEYKDLHINHYLFYPEEKRMSFGEKMIFDKVQAAFQLLN